MIDLLHQPTSELARLAQDTQEKTNMSATTRTITPWTQCVRSMGRQAGRRRFATGNRLQASYGFIGLGRMGEYSDRLLMYRATLS